MTAIERTSVRIEPGKVLAVVSGNALEFFDFLSFAFFAANLSRVMFPAGAPGSALLLTFATAATGFGARPLGAAIMGWIGDRHGRRPAMLLTFFLMGFGAIGLALTPDYRSIGMAAPILVVIFRILQGLAAGGDIGPSTAYLIEAAPLRWRGFFVSLQYVSMRAGAMMGGFVGLGLASVMTPAQLDAYGWRIAFAIGALIVPFALVLRTRLEETLELPEADPDAPTEVSWHVLSLAILGVFGTLVTGGIQDFFLTYAETWLKTPPKQAYLIVIAIGVTYVVGYAAGGVMSDLFGRKRMKLWPVGVALLVTIPMFQWVARTGDFNVLMLAAVTSCLFTSLGSAAILTTLVEITPRKMRASVVGVLYGIAVAIAFGGGPLALTAWLNATHDLAAPGYGLMLGLVCCMVSALLVRDTTPARG